MWRTLKALFTRTPAPIHRTSVPPPETDEAREESHFQARQELLRRLQRIEQALDTVAGEWQRTESRSEPRK